MQVPFAYDHEPPTLSEQLTELHRELAMRDTVYPRLVQQGRLHPSDAARRQLRLAAAIRTLEQVAAVA